MATDVTEAWRPAQFVFGAGDGSTITVVPAPVLPVSPVWPVCAGLAGVPYSPDRPAHRSGLCTRFALRTGLAGIAGIALDTGFALRTGGAGLGGRGGNGDDGGLSLTSTQAQRCDQRKCQY